MACEGQGYEAHVMIRCVFPVIIDYYPMDYELLTHVGATTNCQYR